MTENNNWIMGEAFAIRSKHHESIKALWNTKWKFPVSSLPLTIPRIGLIELHQATRGLYPFHDGNVEAFEEVFDYLIQVIGLN